VTEGQLDIILKDSSTLQLIGNKGIESIYLEKDSRASGLIDGVNLNGWSHEKYIELSESRLRIGRFTTKGSMSVPKGIYIEKYGRFYQGTYDISLLLSKALTLEASKLPDSFRGILRFGSARVEGNTQVRTVNRISPSQWLTTYRNGTTLISGNYWLIIFFLNNITGN
jgi:hypothetical protein